MLDWIGNGSDGIAREKSSLDNTSNDPASHLAVQGE